MWQVTTFLSHMDKLPPQVMAAWKTAATEIGTAASADTGTKAATEDKRIEMSGH
jgi:hypothetical protein